MRLTHYILDGADYHHRNDRIPLQPGGTSWTIPITIQDDTIAEETETFKVTLALVSATVSVTLLNNEVTIIITDTDFDSK